MYVCNCNGLTLRQVDAAIRDGAAGWRDVYDRYGAEPQCGKCVPEICQRLHGARESGPPILGAAEFQGA